MFLLSGFLQKKEITVIRLFHRIPKSIPVLEFSWFFLPQVQCFLRRHNRREVLKAPRVRVKDKQWRRCSQNESCLKAGIKEESKRVKVQRIKNKSPIHLWYSEPLKWICMDLINKPFLIHWGWLLCESVSYRWVGESGGWEQRYSCTRNIQTVGACADEHMNSALLQSHRLSHRRGNNVVKSHTRLPGSSELGVISSSFYIFIHSWKTADTEKLYFELLLTFSSLFRLSAAHGEELHVKDWAYELLMAWIKSARTRRGACLFYLDVII